VIAAVYEPWSPRIGDRVRVRLSGECRWDRDGAAKDDPGHDLIWDRRLGTVVEIHRSAWQLGHDYLVALDACPGGEPHEPSGPHGDWFAAVELEPLGLGP
jgi:hypothetical protein